MALVEPEIRNSIIKRLPAKEREALLAVATFSRSEIREVLIEPNTPIAQVEFVETGLHSMLAVIEGDQVETATVGLEGFVGIPFVLGENATTIRVFCQVSASGWRIDAEQFKSLLSTCPELARICRKYALFVFDQTSQNSACNRTHSIEERTAKWFLLTQDRVATDEFELTQEFLAQMLGVRRQSVNLAAGLLQNAGLISYTRGKLKIVSRAGLEQISCECFQSINVALDRYLA